jgi:uncharacterized protein (UPF0264 family)
MRLLVSVTNAAEVSAALAGGADVIDAKDPHAGALGPVSEAVLRDIHTAVAGARPVSAALGDATDEDDLERDAHAFIAAGALFVKVGFAGIACERAAALTAAAVRGAAAARHGAVIIVGYADVTPLPGPALAETAARAGAAGVLLDTANKRGPGLRGLVTPSVLAAWVAEAHAAGLIVALAGQLTADDLPFVRDAGADIAGVRGAACDGGRTGRVSAARVRLLQARLML